MQLVNYFAGPGAGKSTAAAELFAHLKRENVSCELVTEFIKEVVWDRAWDVMDDQIFVFAQQLHRIIRLIGQVDVVITDSPLLLTLVYDEGRSEELAQLVRAQHKLFDNVNIFLDRTKPFHQFGRTADEEAARDLDSKIYAMLLREGEEFVDILGDNSCLSASIAYLETRSIT